LKPGEKEGGLKSQGKKLTKVLFKKGGSGLRRTGEEGGVRQVTKKSSYTGKTSRIEKGRRKQWEGGGKKRGEKW